MLTTGEWCNPVSNMCKRGCVWIRHEGFENDDSVLGRHPGRGYTGGRRSPAVVDALPSGHFFSRLIRHAGIRWTYSPEYSTPPTGEGGEVQYPLIPQNSPIVTSLVSHDS